MATDAHDFRGTGAFNVNEQYATSIRFELKLDGGDVQRVDLRFMNGRRELATAQLSPAEAREVLGDRNYGAVTKTMAAADAPGRDEPKGTITGELRGKTLEFRQVMLAGYEPFQEENAIFLDSRERSRSERGQEGQGAGVSTARDYATGAAHAAQAAGIGGAGIQATAAAAGLADAARVAADGVEGKPVRPIDAAAASAATIATTGVGSPSVQGAAKAVQAVASAETGSRMAADLTGKAQPEGMAAGADVQAQARLRELRAHALPDAVASRFLRVQDKFYFPDKKLAFVDGGTKLKAETNNLEVVRSIVTIAETRGWEALTVSGAKDFKREVWREANLRGIDVRGYEPSELERQELQRALEKRHGPNEIQREGRHQAVESPRAVDGSQRVTSGERRDRPVETSPAADARATEGAKLLAQAAGMVVSAQNADDPGSARREMDQAQRLKDRAYQQLSAVTVDRAQALVEGERARLAADPSWQSAVRFEATLYERARSTQTAEAPTSGASAPRSTALSGRLIESGHAPYKFDAGEKPSFFVKVQTAAGERTVWGVDLERALAESRTGVKPGDQVTIENLGSKPVTVATPVRDGNGQVVGEKELKTHRNSWVVEKPSYFDERAERAAAFRNGDRAKQELVAQYPDLTNAIATMRLGELFAEKLIDRPEDRERVVKSLRDTLADAIERGEPIQAPKIKEATVRKLDKISGEIDEVAQRAAQEKAAKGTREVGARAKARDELQHARA